MDMHTKLLVTEFTLHEADAQSNTREGTGVDLLWLARQAPDAASLQRAPPDSRRFLQQGTTEAGPHCTPMCRRAGLH